MPRVHTHYDNLKVTRDAPPEVIRAAYQALARKYHPDRNPGDVAAQRVMQLINAAHETLGDPVRREQHDRWIQSMEAGSGALPMEFTAPPPGMPPMMQSVAMPTPVPPAANFTDPDPAGPARTVRTDANLEPPIMGASRPKPRTAWLRYALAVLLAGAGAVIFLRDDLMGARPTAANTAGGTGAPGAAPTLPAGANPPQQRAAAMPGYFRPAKAPSGEPWPAKSDYVPGFKLLFDGGASSITLENRSDADLYVKLYALRDSRSFAVRWVFLKAGESFPMREVRAGRYDVRYRDMDSGAVARSDPFDLEERTVAEGTRVTNIRIALARPPIPTSPTAADADF